MLSISHLLKLSELLTKNSSFGLACFPFRDASESITRVFGTDYTCFGNTLPRLAHRLLTPRSMTYKQAIKTLAAVVGVAFGVTQASAVEITIPDFTGPQSPETPNNVTGVWGLAYGWNGGPSGVAGEDNEVERISKRAPDNSIVNVNAAVKRQAWDVEGMSIGHADHLFLVGGYDFNGGITDGGLPGDLFIKIGPNRDTFKPLSNPSGGTYSNGPVGGPAYATTPGYDYAIHLSGGGLGSGGAVTVTVLDLNSNTILQSDTNDNYGSNPWKVADGRNNIDTSFTTTAHYYQGLTAAGVVTHTDNETSFAGLLGDTDGAGPHGGYTTGSAIDAEAPLTNLHNVLDLDLGWLLGSLGTGTQVWFSYTMQCGNDSLKGHFVVPDGGTSLILMGGALSTLCLFGRRFRK